MNEFRKLNISGISLQYIGDDAPQRPGAYRSLFAAKWF
jgi:hypothetical protein